MYVGAVSARLAVLTADAGLSSTDAFSTSESPETAALEPLIGAMVVTVAVALDTPGDADSAMRVAAVTARLSLEVDAAAWSAICVAAVMLAAADEAAFAAPVATVVAAVTLRDDEPAADD